MSVYNIRKRTENKEMIACACLQPPPPHPHPPGRSYITKHQDDIPLDPTKTIIRINYDICCILLTHVALPILQCLTRYKGGGGCYLQYCLPSTLINYWLN